MLNLPEGQSLIAAEKDYAKVREVLAKNELELDEDLEGLLSFLVEQKYLGEIKGLGKLVSKDWALTQSLRRWYMLEQEGARSSTVQRAFEHVCELAGHGVTGGKGGASTLVDVVIDTLGK